MTVWKCRTCGHLFCLGEYKEALKDHMFFAHKEIPFIIETGYDRFEWKERYVYINFTFSNLKYDENEYTGRFEDRDCDIACDFCYNRKTGAYELWNIISPDNAILPLPIGWLDRKLKEEGELGKTVIKVSY